MRKLVFLAVWPCPRLTPHHIPSQISSCNESRSSPLASFGNEPTDSAAPPLSFGRTPRARVPGVAKGKGATDAAQIDADLVRSDGEL